MDGLAVSPRGDEVVIPEYKGGTVNEGGVKGVRLPLYSRTLPSQ